MEEISISQITDPNKQQPFTGYSLQFLQNALRKDDAGIIDALVTKIVGSYSLTVPYVITGCVLSDSNKDVTAGTLFYGGKFYEVTSVNGTTNVARFIKTKTQDGTADPVTFSDSTTGSVHDIYKYVPTDTASGGDFVATDLVYLASTSSLIAEQKAFTAAATQTTTSTSYVDMNDGLGNVLTYTTPNDGLTRKYRLTLKGISSPDVPSNNNGTPIDGGGWFQIYRDTAITAELDVTKHYIYFVANTSVGDSGLYDIANTSPFYCSTIVSLEPNVTIKCRFKKDGGTSVTISECKFFIEEIK